MTQTTPLTVRLAVEPDGTPIAVDFATTPHVAIVMPTGLGKTLTAKWLIHVATRTGACSALVDVIDPKRVAYRECASTPGVWVHRDMAAQLEGVNALHEEMRRRFTAAEDGIADLDSQVPRLLVVDELNVFDVLAHRWDRDAYSRFVAQFVALLTHGAAARIHVVAASSILPATFAATFRELAPVGVIIAGYRQESVAWRVPFGFGPADDANPPRDVPWPSRSSLAYGSGRRGVRFGRRTFGPADLTWRQA
jgi:hypothetical protein